MKAASFCRSDQAKFDALPPQYSHLYLAVGGTLAAVICIEDPLRQEAKEVIAQLKALGLSKIVMMTGDSYRTAQAVAKEVWRNGIPCRGTAGG